MMARTAEARFMPRGDGCRVQDRLSPDFPGAHLKYSGIPGKEMQMSKIQLQAQ